MPPVGSRPATNPQIDKLERNLAMLSVKQASLEEQMKNLREAVKIDIDKRFMLTYTIAVIFAALGLGSVVAAVAAVLRAFRTVNRAIEERVPPMIDKAMYAVDPAQVEVKLPATGCDMERRRLQWLGFRNFGEFESLSPEECLSGCVVVKIETDEDLQSFADFLKAHSPDPSKVGYVLATTKRISGDIVERFENLTFSNSPATLGTNVFTIARGLLCQQG